MITYAVNHAISTEEFVDLLNRSSLAERRPTEDQECMAGMVNNTNLCVSAWEGEKLVGIARSVTDFHYACYLSDLAVDENLQKSGIGKQLIHLTQKELGPRTTLFLISAPAALDYYPKIGFEANQRCFQLSPEASILGID